MNFYEEYKKKKADKNSYSVLGEYNKSKAQEFSLSLPKMLDEIYERSKSDSKAYSSRFFDKDGKYIGTDNYRSDAASAADSFRENQEWFNKRYKSISSDIEKYKDYLDPKSVEQLTGYLKGYKDSYSTMQEAYDYEKDYFSQWADKDAFEYDKRLKTENLGNVRGEIGTMKADLQAAKDLARSVGLFEKYPASSQAEINGLKEKREKLNSILSKYGYDSVDDFDKGVSEEERFLNKAAYTQEGLKMSSVGDPTSPNYDPDFGIKSAVNSSVEDRAYRYINDIDGAKAAEDEFWFKHGTYTTDSGQVMPVMKPWYMESNLEHMNEDEKRLYNYHYATGGATKAAEYIDKIQETLNARAAGDIAEGFGDSIFLKELFAVEAGFDQFRQGLKGLISDSDYIPTSATQFASAKFRQDLMDEGIGWGVAYDVINTTANMAPSILVSTAVGTLNPLAGSVAGTSLMGASASGNARAQAINLGYSKDQANMYALLVGGSEAALQFALGGIGKLGGKLSSKMGLKFLSGIDNAFARTALKLGGKLGAEALEESLQEVLNPFFENLALNADNDWSDIDWNQVAYNGLLGALSAGMLEGGSTISAEIDTYNQGKVIKDAGLTSNLVELGKSYSADTVAYKLAGKVNENTGAYTIGRLLHEVGADGLSASNIADIEAALEKTGIAPVFSSTIAKWVDKAARGEGFTNIQQMALEMNEDVNMIVHDILINKNSTVNQRIQGYEDLTREAETYSYAQSVMSAVERAQKKAEKKSSKEAVTDEAKESKESVPSQKDVVVESRFDISDDGKTKLSKTGESVTIEQVESIADGEMKLRLDNGDVVIAEDVSFSSNDDGIIYSTLLDMGINSDGANQLLKAFDGSKVSAAVYARGIQEAYTFGKYNLKESGELASYLTDEQRRLAYNYGRIDEKARVAKEQAKINEGNKTVTKRDDAKGVVHFDGDRLSLDKVRSTSLKAMEALAENFGIDFYIFKSFKKDGNYFYKDENGNVRPAPYGKYDTKTGAIYIDLNSGIVGEGAMLYTVAHELGHYIKDWSPSKFNELADFLVARYEEKGVSVNRLVEDQINKAARNGREIDYDTAFEEVVSDSLETMLTSGNLSQTLSELKAKDKGLWNAIKRFFAKWAKVINDIYSKLSPTSPEGRIVAKWKDSIDEIQTMFLESVADASKNYAKADTVEEAKAIEAFGDDLGTVERNADGEMLLATNEDNSTVVYSERTWNEGGRDKFLDLMETLGHGDQAQTYAKYLDDAIDYLHELAKGYAVLDQHLDATITTDIKNGKQVLSAIVNNGDYPVNIDLALICKKRVAYMRVMAKMIEDGMFGGVKYDGDAIAEVNRILRENGFETACLGCFVESRRLQFQTWAETIVQEWNEAVEARNKNAKYFRFSEGKATLSDEEIDALERELSSGKKNAKGNLNLGQGSVEKKMGRLLDKVPSLARKLTVDDLLTPQGLTTLRSTDDNLFSLVKQRYGAASPKIVQDYNPYASEIADLTFETVKKLTGNAVKGAKDYTKAAKDELGAAPKRINGESDKDFAKRKKEYNTKVETLAMRKYLYAIGGARIQSFSDFMIENVFDYLQIIADLSAKGLPMHGYTKEIAAIRLFGMTGVKWNGSLIAHVDRSMGKEYAGLLPASEAKNGRGILVRVDGKDMCIAFDDFARNKATDGKSFIQSIGMKDIIALMYDPRYSSNVGSITIGVSDKQILAMLDSPLFRMVIPYHASGMLPQFAKLVGVDMYNDYTNYQNTTVKEIRLLDGVPYTVEIGDSGKPVVKNEKGDKISIDTHYAFNEKLQKYGDARKTCDDYLAWCRNEHPIYDGGKLIGYATFNPKFSDSPTGVDFTKHRNYYKLIEDFNVYDNITEASAKQGAVTMTFPSAENRLSSVQKTTYEKALRDTGIFTEAEIKKYLEKADMTFEEIVRAEVGNRKAYNDAQEPKFASAVKQIEDYLYNAKDENGKYKYRRDAIADTASDYIEAKNRGISLKPATGSYLDEVRLSDRDYMAAVEDGELGKAQSMVDRMAMTTGYTIKLYHGTAGELFYVFRQGAEGIHFGTLAQATQRAEEVERKQWLIQETHSVDDIRKNIKAYPDSARRAIVRKVAYDSSVELSAEARDAVYDTVYGAESVSDETLLRYLDEAAEQGETEYVLDNFDMQKDTGKRVIAAYVKASDPLVFDIDIGSWTPYNIADLFEAKINGKTVTVWDSKTNTDVEYDPKNVDIELTEADIPAIKNLKKSKYFGDIAAFLQSKGFDSIRYRNTYEGTQNEESYILLSPEQVKSSDPVTYDDKGNVIPLSQRFNSESNDIRYSDRDSEGRVLSEALQEYFKDSTVRDEDGNLLVVYHATDADFTVFEPKGELYGELYYFAVSKTWSKNYFKETRYHNPKTIKKCYLNIANPLDLTGTHETVMLGNDWISYFKSLGVKLSDEFLELWSAKNKNRKSPLGVGGVPAWALFRFDGLTGLRESLVDAGYDGVVLKDTVRGRTDNTAYVAFYKNQIKSTTNTNPTENPDIRYSDRDPDAEASYREVVDQLAKENAKLREDVASLRELLKLQKKVTHGKMFSKTSIDAVASRLMKTANAAGNTSELASHLTAVYTYIINGEDVSWEGIKEKAKDAVDWLQGHRKGGVKTEDYYYEGEMIEQDFLTKIYDSYWDVSTLHTVADKMQREISSLKNKHREHLKKIRESRDEREDKLRKRYQESRNAAIDGRKKTELKHKIRRVVKDLNKVFSRGTKERNVKIGARDAVEAALKLSEVIFNEGVSNEDIVRMGSEIAHPEERELLERYRDLLEERDRLSDPQKIENVKVKIRALDKKLSDLFARERVRLDDGQVTAAIDELSRAYQEIKNSGDEYVALAYQEEVYEKLKSLGEELKGVLVRDMTRTQLQSVYDAYKMIKHMVTESNKAFVNGKKVDLEALVTSVQSQILSHFNGRGKDPQSGANNIAEFVKRFAWNDMKPLTAFEVIGSEDFTKLFWDVIDAESKWARFIDEAKDFLDKQRKDFDYDKWDMESVHEFTLPSGKVFKLTLQDMMSIYAYSKRDQAYDHMMKGGFQFAEHSVYKDTDKAGTKRVHLTSDLYATDLDTIGKIIDELASIHGGKVLKYVDAVQGYLTDLGGRGNEVSRELYGIDIFNEDVYFPLMSARDYRSSVEEALNNTQTAVSLKNTGMTKQTVPHASNPIILQRFDEVVYDHIKKMADYCSLVLPIESLRKVFDSTVLADDGGSVSTKAIVKKVFGKSAEEYFKQYITDLNGGTFLDGAKSPTAEMFSKFKATAVGGSLSVVVQQPFAVIRAMEEISPVHFILGKTGETETKRLYDEIRKYAPIATIKKIGGFDTGSTRSVNDYLGKRTDKGFNRVVDEISDKSTWLAGKADELGWNTIWLAVKREVNASKAYKFGSKEFYDACGRRFTEVIVRTQVYDSVNSRSGFMRSKSELVKFATSFMGEPTAVINEAYLSILNFWRAKGSTEKWKAAKKLGRTAAVLSISILFNSIVKSFVYAARDDEEDGELVERWKKRMAESFGLWGDFNPLTMLPFARDMVSVMEGWEVERPDMTLIANLITSSKRLFDGKEGEGELKSFIGDLGNALGVPVKNIMRDTEAVISILKAMFGID